MNWRQLIKFLILVYSTSTVATIYVASILTMPNPLFGFQVLLVTFPPIIMLAIDGINEVKR